MSSEEAPASLMAMMVNYAFEMLKVWWFGGFLSITCAIESEFRFRVMFVQNQQVYGPSKHGRLQARCFFLGPEGAVG